MHHWRSTRALLFCADGAQSPANDTGAILTRVEAARYLRISVRAFDMHVRGRVAEHRIGRKPLFRKADLESWLDLQKVGGFGSGAIASSCDSPTLASVSSSPRAQAILKKLRRRAAKLYADYHANTARRRLKANDPGAPILEVGALWLAEIEPEVDPGTLGTLMGYVRHFQRFFEMMGRITDAACLAYMRERLSRVKRQTIKKELGALRRFVRWATEHGLFTRAPVVPSLPPRAPGTPFEKRRRGKATPLTPEEVEAIIAALPEWSSSKKVARFPVRARFRLMWETALRPSTIDQLSVPENYATALPCS
jgi:hypothetical protein